MDEDLKYLREVELGLKLHQSASCEEAIEAIEGRLFNLKVIYLEEIAEPKFHLIGFDDKISYILKSRDLTMDESTLESFKELVKRGRLVDEATGEAVTNKQSVPKTKQQAKPTRDMVQLKKDVMELLASGLSKNKIKLQLDISNYTLNKLLS